MFDYFFINQIRGRSPDRELEIGEVIVISFDNYFVSWYSSLFDTEYLSISGSYLYGFRVVSLKKPPMFVDENGALGELTN